MLATEILAAHSFVTWNMIIMGRQWSSQCWLVWYHVEQIIVEMTVIPEYTQILPSIKTGWQTKLVVIERLSLNVIQKSNPKTPNLFKFNIDHNVLLI